jgi:hypothetical protein
MRKSGGSGSVSETLLSCFELMDVLFWELKASPVAWASFIEAYR